MQHNHLFLLGGHDLEMQVIRELLHAHAPDRYVDKGLSWGAKASDYREEIDTALCYGETPVLVELEDDLGLAERVVISVDHHGPLAGADRPTALHQVFGLLGLPPELWTRHMELVAANDRGYISGMLAVGATLDEIAGIRADDRAAQGITEEEERQAEEAIATGMEQLCEGRLTLVRLPHNRTAAVFDRLAPELGGPGFKNLLVASPTEVNFFGNGEVVARLVERYPDSWYGGALPERGFWGRTGTADEILGFLRECLGG